MHSRRGFMGLVAGMAATPRLGWADAGNPSYLACAREADGGFALFGLSAAGADLFRVALPARGHAGARHPQRPLAVVFARRPGTYALVIDCATGAVLHRLVPPAGRHLNGHGAFIHGGAVLATVEQDAATSDGRIGLWSVDDGWRRIGEIGSGGIGPHDLRILPDGLTMVVANGGIATDPDDRAKLNLATMRPNLTYLSARGEIVDLAEPEPDLRQGSIRHLAVAPDGTVAFAMQWEGDPYAAPPLLGLHRQGSAPILAELPEPEALAMSGYAGSIAVGAAGREVAITSPRGGRVQRFDLAGRFLGAVARADVCGIAPMADGFLASDGAGGLLTLEGTELRPLALAPRAWDNHIVLV
jgi:hypothetical protein